MDVFLTGGTGLVGSSVLVALQEAGHSVHALARSDSSAQALEQAGATVVRGELTDRTVVGAAAAAADAVVHTASPGDASSADADRAVAEAVLAAAPGRPYVHTGGCWVFGSGEAIEETSPKSPPQLTAWRLAIEQTVLDGGGRIVAPGVVYGDGKGLPALLTGAPQVEGELLFPGPGTQHWVTIHSADLGRLYVAVLEKGQPADYVLGVDGRSVTVRELAEAAARGQGLASAAPELPQETEARLGPLAEALDLDQQASGAKARTFGWSPREVDLVTDLSSGSYAAV